jgi:hypothetical protein
MMGRTIRQCCIASGSRYSASSGSLICMVATWLVHRGAESLYRPLTLLRHLQPHHQLRPFIVKVLGNVAGFDLRIRSIKSASNHQSTRCCQGGRRKLGVIQKIVWAIIGIPGVVDSHAIVKNEVFIR